MWNENESIEELVEVKNFRACVKEGDLIKIESLQEGLQVDLLKEETESVKEKARAIKEQLLKQSEEKE